MAKITAVATHAEHAHGADAADRIRTIPDPGEKVPLYAWPTLLLFGAALTMYLGSCLLYLGGALPWPGAVIINAVAGYMMFTVSYPHIF